MTKRKYNPDRKSGKYYDTNIKKIMNKFVAENFSNGRKCLILDHKTGNTTKTLIANGVSPSLIINVNRDPEVIKKLKKFQTGIIQGDVFDVLYGMKTPPPNVWLDLVNNIKESELQKIQKILKRISGRICWFITAPSRKYKKRNGRGYFKVHDLMKYYTKPFEKNNICPVIRSCYGPSHMMFLQFRNYGDQTLYYRMSENNTIYGMVKLTKYIVARHRVFKTKKKIMNLQSYINMKI